MIFSVVRYCCSTTKALPSARAYVQRFETLQSTLRQQRKKIQQLHIKENIVSQASKMTIKDSIAQSLCKVTGSKFQSEAIKCHKQELINHQKNLEKLVQQSDKKWEKPRQEIIKLRKQISEQFLTNFIKLQEELLKAGTYKSSQELIEGISLIHRLLVSTIQKHGVIFFQPHIGDEVTNDMEIQKGEKGVKVKEIVSKGWKIGDKIIKKAVVRVK